MASERKRKPLWARLLIGLGSTILSIAVLLGMGVGFVYIKYKINVFEVIGQVQTLNQTVNMERLITNPFTEDDTNSIKSVVEIKDGAVSFKTDAFDEHHDKYEFTDKELGALMNYVIDNQNEILVQIGTNVNLKDYGFEVMQVDISNPTETGADFNIVVKIDLTKLKNEKMKSFPFNWIANAVPDSLYFSSTVTITKGENFTYTTESKEFYINNLTAKETTNIFDTINIIIKLGSADEFNKTIGDTFVNLLIGTESQKGLAYSLYDGNIYKSFNFENVDDIDYFVLKN